MVAHKNASVVEALKIFTANEGNAVQRTPEMMNTTAR